MSSAVSNLSVYTPSSGDPAQSTATDHVISVAIIDRMGPHKSIEQMVERTGDHVAS